MIIAASLPIMQINSGAYWRGLMRQEPLQTLIYPAIGCMP
jgi:hypothetical protein